jgi:hypothetical protein
MFRNTYGLVAMWAIAIFLVWSAVAATNQQRPAIPENDLDRWDKCMSHEMRDKIRGMMLKSVENGFMVHVEHIFNVWLREYSSKEEPQRAVTGVNNGIRAYIRAKEGIERWNPPECKQ